LDRDSCYSAVGFEAYVFVTKEFVSNYNSDCQESLKIRKEWRRKIVPIGVCWCEKVGFGTCEFIDEEERVDECGFGKV
jgi:hypothetical protein